MAKQPNMILAEAQKALANAPVTGGRPVEYPDVLAKFGGFLVLVVAGGLIGWLPLYKAIGELNSILYLGGLIALVVVAILAGKQLRASNIPVGVALAATYAIGQGVFIGYISRSLQEAFGNGLVGQALLATSITVLVVVAYSATPLGKRTGRALKAFTIIVTAYLLFSLVSLGFAVFAGTGDGWGFFGLGWFGMLLCLAGVAFAAWSVNTDVVAITDVVESREDCPPGTDWLLAFGLTVSILWLYLEILRLFARR